MKTLSRDHRVATTGSGARGAAPTLANHLAIDGGGPIVAALADGRKIAASPDGAVRLPNNYREGSIVHRAKVATP